jgi:hypothetical protein
MATGLLIARVIAPPPYFCPAGGSRHGYRQKRLVAKLLQYLSQANVSDLRREESRDDR